jgi:hypothetical protein
VKVKTRQILSKYIDQGTIAGIRTETLKDGKTNVTVVINLGKVEINKREIEAKIINDFIDLPINLRIKWN